MLLPFPPPSLDHYQVAPPAYQSEFGPFGDTRKLLDVQLLLATPVSVFDMKYLLYLLLA